MSGSVDVEAEIVTRSFQAFFEPVTSEPLCVSQTPVSSALTVNFASAPNFESMDFLL